MIRPIVLSIQLACIPLLAKAHEFWIDPEAHQLAPGTEIVANIRVGQAYKGSALSFLPPQFRRFDYEIGDQFAPVPGTIGDRPAVAMQSPGEGLLVLVHETGDQIVNYSEFSKFVKFVIHKDAAWVVREQREAGIPQERFREVYSRYAKSLVAVGEGAGQDRVFGLETEIVALENPYTGDMSDGIDVELLYQGAPRVGTQIEVFEKAADDSVVITTVMTDEAGRATVPVTPGHRYMLDAVVLRRPSPELAEEKNAIWESLWANLTFEVPG